MRNNHAEAQIWVFAASNVLSDPRTNATWAADAADALLVEFKKRFKWDIANNDWIKRKKDRDE